MTPKAQRKLAVGVLGLGLGALVVDKVFLSPSGEVERDDQYTVVSEPTEEEIASVPQFDVTRTENSIRERLNRVATSMDAGVSADAFMMPASWRVIEQAPTEDAQRPTTPVSSFEQDYQLRTVMASQTGQGFATLICRKVNQAGRITMRPGEVIDGHKLVKIEERSAVFEGPTGQVTLKLAEPHTGRESPFAPGQSDPE